MAYADTKAALLTHAQAAGAALTNPITDVLLGFANPKGRCIRIYWGGETEQEKMGGRYTLNSEMIGQRTIVAAFLPITTLSEDLAAAIDAEMTALAHELRTRFNGDAQLGGTQSDLTLNMAEPDFVTFGNTRYVVVFWEVIGDYFEYSIAV